MTHPRDAKGGFVQAHLRSPFHLCNQAPWPFAWTKRADATGPKTDVEPFRNKQLAVLWRAEPQWYCATVGFSAPTLTLNWFQSNF